MVVNEHKVIKACTKEESETKKSYTAYWYIFYGYYVKQKDMHNNKIYL